MQALTLKEKLNKNNHQVVAVITGRNKHSLPQFFKDEIEAPVFFIDSPVFILDKDGAGIRTVASFIDSLKRSPLFFKSLKEISKIIKEFSPDALISFYEPLAGIYVRLYRDKRPLFCIAHQYFISHSSCLFPEKSAAEQKMFKFFNSLNAPQRSVKIALSFTKELDAPDQNLFVCPPLIRSAIMSEKPKTDDYILVYLLNSGYFEEIADWSRRHPEVVLEAFTTNFIPPEKQPGSRLTWHQLSGKKFIDRLSSCRAYVSTAGFDSIAEAAFLGKNILMVPTKNHFEQACNAVDAKRAGLAIYAKNFDLNLIINDKKTHSNQSLRAYQEWVLKSSNKIIDILEQ